ncbi:MAG: DUF5071 domain-containing protein [Crocinitomicaceae bacterium]|nr:DUF5071 domain-containing protein [Crocinitomicaceae bacterium]MBK8925191.1 DUF5071 domain-containing protein [Crocinitomicaceae bacterium]
MKRFITNLYSYNWQVKEILHGNNAIWKYWIISRIGRLVKDSGVLHELQRIAFHPTKREIVEYVDQLTREILS